MKAQVLIFMFCCLLIGVNTATAIEYNVLQHGAVGDGKTLNTKCLQGIIDELHTHGGGVMYFPAGHYLTGSLRLKSDVTLHLERDAVLLGSTSPYDYPHFSPKNDLKVNDDHFNQALIYADGAERIGIMGYGKKDGQGRELALTIDSLHHTGELVDPHYNTYRKRPNTRPKLLYMHRCTDVEIKNIQAGNSAAWGLSFERCSGITLDSLRVENWAYWNNDGIDISDCKDVHISNCSINSADDGICLKSHNRDACNDRISISNCRIISSASAIKFGTESMGGFRNVTIDSIWIKDTFRSAIAIESVDGAEIENVLVSNVRASNTGNALFIRLGHRSGDKPGYVRNITVKNLYVEIPFGRPDINYDLRGPAVTFFHNPFPASISGIPGHDIEDVKLENIEIVYPGRASKGMAYIPLSRLEDVPENIKGYPEFTMFEELPSWGFYVRHVKGIQMNGIKLHLKADDFRPAFVFDRINGLRLTDICLPDSLKNGQVVLRESCLLETDTEVKEWIYTVD